MNAAELRGGSKPSLNEALGWIGSRVDDIYGANVGRLEDVWIDPGTGIPRWLLVKENRFGGRTTLVPFEDATAGAGHVWVPYECDIVRDAPEIEAGAPLTQQGEAALRSHYAANAPAAISHRSDSTQPLPGGREPGSAAGTATIHFGGPTEAGPPETSGPFETQGFHSQSAIRQPAPPPRRHVLREGPRPPQRRAGDNLRPGAGAPEPALRMPERPAPPMQAPGAREPSPSVPSQPQPRHPGAPGPVPYALPPSGSPEPGPQGYDGVQQPEQFVPPQPLPDPVQAIELPAQARPSFAASPTWEAPQPAPSAPGVPTPPPAAAPGAAQAPLDALRALAETGETHFVEIELSGAVTIRGELRSLRVTPRDGLSPG